MKAIALLLSYYPLQAERIPPATQAVMVEDLMVRCRTPEFAVQAVEQASKWFEYFPSVAQFRKCIAEVWQGELDDFGKPRTGLPVEMSEREEQEAQESFEAAMARWREYKKGGKGGRRLGSGGQALQGDSGGLEDGSDETEGREHGLGEVIDDVLTNFGSSSGEGPGEEEG
jgi:hypothetical protein